MVFSGFAKAKIAQSELKLVDNCEVVPEPKTDLISCPKIFNVKASGLMKKNLSFDDPAPLETLERFEEPVVPKLRQTVDNNVVMPQLKTKVDRIPQDEPLRKDLAGRGTKRKSEREQQQLNDGTMLNVAEGDGCSREVQSQTSVQVSNYGRYMLLSYGYIRSWRYRCQLMAPMKLLIPHRRRNDSQRSIISEI